MKRLLLLPLLLCALSALAQHDIYKRYASFRGWGVIYENNIYFDSLHADSIEGVLITTFNKTSWREVCAIFGVPMYPNEDEPIYVALRDRRDPTQPAPRIPSKNRQSLYRDYADRSQSCLLYAEDQNTLWLLFPRTENHWNRLTANIFTNMLMGQHRVIFPPKEVEPDSLSGLAPLVGAPAVDYMTCINGYMLMDNSEVTHRAWREYYFWVQRECGGPDQPEVRAILPDSMACVRLYGSADAWLRPELSDFPVVGISQEQALAYCRWRSLIYRNSADLLSKGYRLLFGLPDIQNYEDARFHARLTHRPAGSPVRQVRHGRITGLTDNVEELVFLEKQEDTVPRGFRCVAEVIRKGVILSDGLYSDTIAQGDSTVVLSLRVRDGQLDGLTINGQQPKQQYVYAYTPSMQEAVSIYQDLVAEGHEEVMVMRVHDPVTGRDLWLIFTQ